MTIITNTNYTRDRRNKCVPVHCTRGGRTRTLLTYTLQTHLVLPLVAVQCTIYRIYLHKCLGVLLCVSVCVECCVVDFEMVFRSNLSVCRCVCVYIWIIVYLCRYLNVVYTTSDASHRFREERRVNARNEIKQRERRRERCIARLNYLLIWIHAGMEIQHWESITNYITICKSDRLRYLIVTHVEMLNFHFHCISSTRSYIVVRTYCGWWWRVDTF